MAAQSAFKLVALDMDGTLLDNNHCISNENRSMLLDLHDRGIEISICTGRSTACAMPLFKHFPPHFDCTFVTYNGACAYSKGKAQRHLLFDCPVSGAVTDRILDIALEHDFVVNVYVGDTIHACCRNDSHRQLCQRYQDLTSCTYEFHADNYQRFRGFELSKVLVLAREGDELDKLQSLLQQHLPHSDAHLVRGNFFFEILHPAVNKGAGLRGLCEKLQIPLSEVVAMGDGDNDAEFLAVAGQGIAMINGTPMAKRAASRISERSNHENGVAHELRRVFASIL